MKPLGQIAMDAYHDRSEDTANADHWERAAQAVVAEAEEVIANCRESFERILNEDETDREMERTAHFALHQIAAWEAARSTPLATRSESTSSRDEKGMLAPSSNGRAAAFVG